MNTIRRLSWAILIFVCGCALLSDFIAPAGYAEQFREHASEGPSVSFPLGTDELGRDRLARLLYGTRLSLFLAPAAALVATAIALVTGIAAGWIGGVFDRAICFVTDVLLSVPSLFLLLTARAALPLDMSPVASVVITFALLGCLGWANPSRVVAGAVRGAVSATWLVQARAAGASNWRIGIRHVMPALRPVTSAVFWTSVPVFLMAEANLGLLGLGVTEPLPTLGTLLADLQSFHDLPATPWRLAPAALLVMITGASHVVSGSFKEKRS